MKRLLPLVLAVLLVGCPTSTFINTDLTGTWKTQLGEMVILVDLTESGSNLTGSVTFTEPTGTREGSAVGQVNGANVSLTLTPSSGGSVDFSGVVQNDITISGRATSTDFTPVISDEVMLLIRQQ